MNYKLIKDECGVCKYESINYDIYVIRGSLSNNKPSGYNVYDKNGKCFKFFLTLKEAKEYVEKLTKKMDNVNTTYNNFDFTFDDNDVITIYFENQVVCSGNIIRRIHDTNNSISSKTDIFVTDCKDKYIIIYTNNKKEINAVVRYNLDDIKEFIKNLLF